MPRPPPPEGAHGVTRSLPFHSRSRISQTGEGSTARGRVDPRSLTDPDSRPPPIPLRGRCKRKAGFRNADLTPTFTDLLPAGLHNLLAGAARFYQNRARKEAPPVAQEDPWRRAAARMPLEGHLTELRDRLIISAVSVLPFFIVLFVLHNAVLETVLSAAHPYIAHLHFLSPTEAFFTFIRVAFVFSLVLASPIWLYEVLAFFLPAFGPATRSYVLRILPAVTGLFLLGLAFGYFVFVPLALRFLMSFASGVFVSDITFSNYISFLFASVIPFGAIFEIPMLSYGLTAAGMIRPQMLTKNRRWAILGAAVLSATFSPPGPVPMLIMGIPILLLYEAAIWVSVVTDRRRTRRLGGQPPIGANPLS